MSRPSLRCGDQVHAGNPAEAWPAAGFFRSAAARDGARGGVRTLVEGLRREAAWPKAPAALYRRRSEDALTRACDADAWLAPRTTTPATRGHETGDAAPEPRP